MTNTKSTKDQGTPAAAASASKLAVPRPVTCKLDVSETHKVAQDKIHTGSQPVSAGKPFVPQPGLSPAVMSVKVDAAIPYKNGFRNPSGLLPVPMSLSLMRDITLAKMGVEQLVPPVSHSSCFQKISTFSPIAATSGNPRPLRLNNPAFVLPRLFRYVETEAT